MHMRLHIHRRRSALALGAAIAVLGLSASCSWFSKEPAAAPEFYTLVRPAPTVRAETAPYQLEVLRVQIPEQVDVPQMVVRKGQGQLIPVDTRRWIAPLNAELRSALSQELARMLGARDVRGVGRVPELPIYRVRVRIQRFDSVLEKHAHVEAVWSVSEQGPKGDKGKGRTLLCGSEMIEPALGGYDGLARAHQRAVVAIARQIATGIREMRSSDGRPATCPGDTQQVSQRAR